MGGHSPRARTPGRAIDAAFRSPHRQARSNLQTHCSPCHPLFNRQPPQKIALISNETTENPRNPARFGNPTRRQCSCRNGYIFPRRSRNGTRDLGGMLAAGISQNLGDACADAELCNWRAMDRDAGWSYLPTPEWTGPVLA